MIPGSNAITWGDLYFGKHVMNARDRFGPDFYAHRLPHRSGAKQELTGNVPWSVTYTLVFAGVSWSEDAKRVLGAFIARPRDTLTHHIKGKLRAVVKPIDAQWDPVNEGTRYQATVTFEEDTLTNDPSFDRTPGTVAEDISASTEAADQAASGYTSDIYAKYTVGIPAMQLRAQSTAAQAQMLSFTDSVREFAESSLLQFQAGQQQISQDSALGRLPTLCEATLNTWRALPSVSPYAQVAMSAAELALYQAGELSKAIRANLPPPLRWTVSQQTTLAALVGKLYPTRSRDDKLDLIGQIAVQNKLLNPHALRAGQVIVIPAP